MNLVIDDFIWINAIQQISQQMQLPEQTYRWLVSIKIIPNEGESIQKNMVSIGPNLAVHFQSGYSISEAIKNILVRSGQKPPACLDNVRKETNKNTKQTNWNFVWVSFDDLRMQFDNRIKQLILQGQSVLVVGIIKQLYDIDEHKDQKLMQNVVIAGKNVQNKMQKTNKTSSKGQALDIKKINLQKDPEQSDSSLQFLILLLSNSLNMSVQQILGLFTNQNKFLAHVIVKGINDDFTGIVLFYTMLNKYSKKLKDFCEQDQKDAQSCLYAIKPGFISKSQQVTKLTIQIFGKVGDIYHWLVNQNARGSTTILLGIKRHPQLTNDLWNLLYELIQTDQIGFFKNNFKQSFKDAYQMIDICKSLAQPIGDCYIRDKLLQIGVLSEWMQLAVNLFEGSVDDQILALSNDQNILDFFGQMMLNLPDSLTENEQCLTVLKRGWQQRKMTQFVLLIDEIILILQNLAANRNSFASKVYQIIIQIFQDIAYDSTKKQYLVQNFCPIVQQFPKMPSHYFIQAYPGYYMDAADNLLVATAINNNEDIQGLAEIGEFLLKIFTHNAVVNGYTGPHIYNIAKKVIDDEIGEALVKKAVKDCLNAYSIIQINKKIPQVAKVQPMYFNHKGNSEKVSPEQADNYKVREKQAHNLLVLVDKLCDLSKSLKNDNLETQLREQLLDTNAHIRRNKNKVSSKGISNILRKFNISKQDENDYDEEYRNKKSIVEIEQSLTKKKNTLNNLSQLAASRVGGPQHLRKQFSDIVQKRKKEEEQKKVQLQRKQKEQLQKKTLVKKQIQKMQLLRGFGSGQSEPKQQGFWNRFVKEDSKQLQLYPPELMEPRDIQYIENMFKKYHKVLRYLFLKYTASMHSIKSVNNFDDNHARKQVINTVQIIKFLKDYKLFFLTSNNQVLNMVRDINVKLLNKRQNQDLDFSGFEQFIIQFASVNFTKTHTVNKKTSKGNQNEKKNLNHVAHGELVEQLFNYIKLVFVQKGQKTTMFDEPQTAYFNETQIIKQFNKKIQQDPGFILPEGYKKITDKTITYKPLFSQSNKKGIGETYLDVMEVLDEILYESSLKLHILQPISEKVTVTRVKPHAFTNIKPKLMTDTMGQSKARVMSSIVQRKNPAIPPVKMLQRKVLSFGMKLGLSYVNYKDKLLGQQVAYVIDDMLTAVENGKTTIQKQKVVNEAMKRRKQMEDMERKVRSDKQKKRKQRKEELQKIKKDITQKKEKQLQDTKQERQKKKQKKISIEKKKKQQMQKYLADQKAKLQQKKKKEEEEKAKIVQQKKKKRQESKKAKEKFKQFNQKQIQRLKKGFEQTAEQKKKNQEQMQQQKKHKQEIYKKLRNKISAQDKKIIQLRHKNNQEIAELYNSQQISNVFQKFEPNLKAIFDFLIKNTFLSLTDRKHNNQIILETWNYFSLTFHLNPYIISSKQIQNIFRSLTKDKQIRKQYYLGLNFEEFQQALLRVAIKHKSVFNKIAQKIKEDDMSEKEIDAVIQKDHEQKQKNQFEQPKQIDVKGLLVQQDIKKQIADDYGDISKVNSITLKGLIYYLKVPKDKQGQQKRFREVLSDEGQYVQKYQKLKEKLKQEYSLASPKKKTGKNLQQSTDSIKRQEEENQS